MHSKMRIVFLVSCICICVCFAIASGEKRGDESKYTKKEENALTQLRKVVAKDLYADYMQRDEYLINWLRTKKLDVDRAAELLRKHLKWRIDENVDNMPNENYPQFTGFEFDYRGRDKEGRPISTCIYSTWDTRKAALSGQMKTLIRMMVKNIFEMPQLVARKEGQADGTNATQAIYLLDLNGYNLRQHGCLRCLELYTGYMLNYEGHYPQLFNKQLIINNPRIFDTIVELVRPIFSDYFAKNLRLLGPNKDDWKPEVLKYINADQIQPRFGGTSSRKPQSE